MVEIIPPLAAGINAPAGIQFVPATQNLSTNDFSFFIPVFKDTTGDPDRIVCLGVTTTSGVTVTEYKRNGESWIFDPVDCARDNLVSLGITASGQTKITGFAIDDPVGTGDRVLFIALNDASQTPDTFEIVSIVLTPGATSLTASAVVIAGTNQPTDTNTMVTIGIPLSTTRVMTLFEDDAHFADVTESGGTYTFTYDDSKVLAIDTSISVDQNYSGIVVGSQLALLHAGVIITSSGLWEMSTAAVLTEEWLGFAHGSMGSIEDQQYPSGITAIGGVFATAGPTGSGGSSQEPAYNLSTFEINDI